MTRSLTSQSGNKEEEIQTAVEQGPITKQYLTDPQRVASSLNRLRSMEIISYLQYKQHGYMAVSLLAPGLKSEFESHANQELEHADRLAIRIQSVGRRPYLVAHREHDGSNAVVLVEVRGATASVHVG
jgi:bacterioferritin